MATLESILGQKVPSPGGLGNSRQFGQSSRSGLLASNGELITPAPEPSVAERIAKNMEAYFYNPWAMIEDQIIYTLDQTDALNPTKALPNQKWLEVITQTWMEEPLFALYKSRRMIITWLMIYLHTWMAMFREGAAIFFVSDKEDKSDELVRRAKFIVDHIPDDMMLKPRCEYKFCKLTFPGLSTYIQGVPQGADQLRQFTASAVFADEFAFWDKARETFMASKPTIDGGGKFTCVSSPKAGFFKELCFDQVR